MEDYTKLYHLLFNAITDALEQMNAQNFGSAKETLVSAQQKALADPAGAFCFLFSLFRTSAKEAAALVPRGEQRLALHG